MKVSIFEMRCYGVEVPRRRVLDQSRHDGDLSIATVTDQGMHRPVRVARLRAPGDTKIIMELVEPQLLWMELDRFVLAGFQRVRNAAGARVDYAQSWLCLSEGAALPVPDDEGGRWKYGKQSRY